MSRLATCQCGALRAMCEGEPAYVSVCHCLDCQKRSGAPFASQARFPADRVTFAGESRTWRRTGDDGGTAEMHFCPTCGSTVWYRSRPHSDAIAVAIGAFADPGFPAPWFSVYEERKHPWVSIVGEGIEHVD